MDPGCVPAGTTSIALGVRGGLERVEHCRWRHDYGLRYLGEDLPADVAEELAALVPGAGPDLRSQSGTCFDWLDRLLER